MYALFSQLVFSLQEVGNAQKISVENPDVKEPLG